ncbi:MAG: nitrate- and nitrite sensing domain-containing protein [Pseudomonadales bacterium]|nr:nitrate- and nitrite sensing domain-containing protein [Pseudomonadales bacterium]
MNELAINSTSLTITVVFPVLLLILIGVLFLRKVRQQRKEQIEGLNLILTITRLVKLLQQHRGLSYGLLRGDRELLVRLNQVEQQIGNCIGTLMPVPRVLSELERWVGFESHWASLSRRNLEIAAENNLEQHSLMIANLLFMIEDIAEVSHLTDNDIKSDMKISNLWRLMLQSAEWVGQARALGTGVAATGTCTSVERIRLKFLRGKIAMSMAMINSQDSGLAEAVELPLRGLQNLLQTMDESLIAAQRPSVTPEHYFDLATESIESIIKVFDELIGRLQGIIKV